MKKALLYLCIPTIILAVGGCKKPCYTCWAQVTSAYQIDTFDYYGVTRYDTTGGGVVNGWKFETCETNSRYSYGNLTISPTTQIDTFISCQQNNY